MKIVSVLAAAAALALTATAASAGGFKYGSLGGNFGTFANINGSAFGSAKTSGYGCHYCGGGGATQSVSEIQVDSYKGYYSSGAAGWAANQSSFQGGYGTAHSQSGISASAGVGYGIGGQIGGFKKLH